ncbi:MAG: hypothetical protein K2X93_20850 [Candidatus Obscuribacterales bacterium]|nr:hypothetical protein [Candidatus Obscuribacterales bacterium]
MTFDQNLSPARNFTDKPQPDDWEAIFRRVSSGNTSYWQSKIALVNADGDKGPLPADNTKVSTELPPEAKLEKVESSEDKTQSNLRALQELLLSADTAINMDDFGQRMQTLLVARIQEKARKGELPPEVQAELKTLTKEKYEERLQELGAEEFKNILRKELKTYADSGKLDKEQTKILEDKIRDGEVPAELVLNLLDKELESKTFGDITRTLYVTLVEDLEKEVPFNFIRLVDSKLEIPTDFPIQAPMRADGRPAATNQEIANELIALLKKDKIPQKIVDGDPQKDIPTEADLENLKRFGDWNIVAARRIYDNINTFQAGRLQEKVFEFKRPKWAFKTGEDLEGWAGRAQPLVEIANRVTSVAQGLKLGEKQAKSNSTLGSIDKEALTTGFPGKISFDDNDNISFVEIELPDTLTRSFENEEKIKAVIKWLEANEARANQVCAELAAAAIDSGRILIWEDIPSKGKIEKDGRLEEFNLQKLRITTEKITDESGKKKIRIYNHVDYEYGGLLSCWDLITTRVGTRECYSLVDRAEFDAALKDANLPKPKLDSLYSKLEAKQKEIGEKSAQSEKVSENKKDLDAITKILESEFPPEVAAKYREKIFKNYRDYDENDLVCIENDGKVQLMRAKEIEGWTRRKAAWHVLCKGLEIGLDVGMCVSGIGSAGIAIKGAVVAGRAAGKAALKNVGTTVVREAIKDAAKKAVRNHAFHAGKSLTIGISGGLLNNSFARTDDVGRWALMARDTAFFADGVLSLGKTTAGAVGKFGRKPPLTFQARADARIEKLVSSLKTAARPKEVAAAKGVKDAATSTGKPLDAAKAASVTKRETFGEKVKFAVARTLRNNDRSLMVGTFFIGYQLAKGLMARFDSKNKHEPGLAVAEQLLGELQMSKANTRSLVRTAADAISGKDVEFQQGSFKEIAEGVEKAQKLGPEAKKEKTDELIRKFDTCSDKKEMALIAIGLLALNQKEDGTFDNVIGKRTQTPVLDKEVSLDVARKRRDGGNLNVYSAELLDTVKKEFTTCDADQKLAMARVLMAFNEFDKAEYIILCRDLIKNPAASSDTRMEAILTITDFAATAKEEKSGSKVPSELFLNYGCTPKELEQTLVDAAKTLTNKEEQAFVVGLLDALKGKTPEEVSARISLIGFTWMVQKLDREFKELKATPDETDTTKQELAQQRLSAKRDELEAVLQLIAVVDDPKLLIEFKQRREQSDKLREAESMELCESTYELGLVHQEIADASDEDRAALEEKVNAAEARFQAAERKVLDRQREENSNVDKGLLTLVPTSLSAIITDRLISELRATGSETQEQQLRTLQCVDALMMLSGGKESLQPNELERKLLSHVKMENGVIAVEAIKRLQSSGNKAFLAENKDTVLKEVLLILNSDSNRALFDNSNSADGKAHMLDYLPELLDKMPMSESEKEKFIEPLVNVLDRSSVATHASQHPQVRVKAIVALGKLASLINNSDLVSAKRKQRVSEILLDTMQLPSTSATPADRRRGDSSVEVRRAAYDVARLICSPKELSMRVVECTNTERDPELATRYASVELQSLRPDRPDCARRLYATEVLYWDQLLESNKDRIDKFGDRLKSKYDMLYSDTRKDKLSQARSKMKDEDWNSNLAGGLSLAGMCMGGIIPMFAGSGSVADQHYKNINANTKKYNAVRDEENTQWKKLTETARKTGKEGDEAKEELVWMATSGNVKQKAAAEEIRKMVVEENMPGKMLFLSYLMEAFRNNNTTEKVDARKEVIKILSHLANADPALRVMIGRMAHEALGLELKRFQVEVGEKFDENAPVPDGVSLQKSLIDIMVKCDYPLAMPILQSLSTSKYDYEGKPITVHPALKGAALTFLQDLQSTAPRTPFDRKDAEDRLRTAVSQRKNFTQQDEKKNKVLYEIKKSPGMGKVEKQKLLAGASVDPANAIDSLSTKNLINDVFMANPITDQNDGRIFLLQELLDDSDLDVALVAAWHLVRAIDPERALNEPTRAAFRNQPFVAKAIDKLKDISKIDVNKPVDGLDAQTAKRVHETRTAIRNDAVRILKIVQTWDKGALEKSLNNDLDAQRVKESFRVLNEPNSSEAERRESLEAILRLAAGEYRQNNTKFQSLVQNELMIKAISSDANFGAIAFDAVSSVQRDNKPISSKIDYTGKTVLTFNGGSKTTITTGLNQKRIDYPDSSWMIFTYDAKGKVSGYESSETKGVIETNFLPGAVNLTNDGVVVIDQTNGVRTVRLEGGDKYSFFNQNFDSDKATKVFENELAKATSDAEKISVIKKTIDGFGPDAAPISSVQDKRITALYQLIAPAPTTKAVPDAVAFAAARAILDPRNRGIDSKSDVYRDARKVFLENELKSTFIRKAPTEKLLQDMQDTMRFFGPITSDTDARRQMFTAALKSENKQVRLLAAKTVAEQSNTTFTQEDRLSAIKVMLETTYRADENATDYVDAFAIIESAGKSLPDNEYKLGESQTLKIKGGKLIEFNTSYKDGSASCKWNTEGSYELSFVIGKIELKSYRMPSLDANHKHRVLSCLNTTGSAMALRMAENSTDSRLALTAQTAKLSGPKEYRWPALDRITYLAATSKDQELRGTSAVVLGCELNSCNPYDLYRISRLWEKHYQKGGGVGIAPYPIPFARLKEFTFPEDATQRQKEEMIYHGIGWLNEVCSNKLTGKLDTDAQEIEKRSKDGEGTYNYHEVCAAIFASLKFSPIKDAGDPRREVLRRLASESASDRVKVAASYMLTYSSIPEDVQAATDCLAKMAMHGNSWALREESKALLRDMVFVGTDTTNTAALKSWQEAWRACPQLMENPPVASSRDKVTRYLANANKDERSNLLGEKLSTRKVVLMELNGWTESELETAITAPNAEKLVPYVDTLTTTINGPNPRPMQLRSDAFVPGEKKVFQDLGLMEAKKQPPASPLRFLIVDDQKSFSQNKKKEFVEQTLQSEKIPPRTPLKIVANSATSEKKMTVLDESLVDAREAKKPTWTGDRILNEDKETPCFAKSVSDETWGQFCADLFRYRPDVANGKDIDAVELAVLLRNWIVQSAKAKETAQSKPRANREENQFRIVTSETYNKPARDLNYWARVSESESYYRERKVNELLNTATTTIPRNDGRLRWQAMSTGGVAIPDLIRKPPIERLEQYQTNVIALLPEGVKPIPIEGFKKLLPSQSRIPIECLRRSGFNYKLLPPSWKSAGQ